ncbi:hypothetical protein PS639_03799 [Pseudomonas fluorescens]|nr:hypothetical protein PS639_03799 [Pseudomonas fluorescens]
MSLISGLSLADHITFELRADIIGGRLLPGMALVENDLVSACNGLHGLYIAQADWEN